MKRKILTVLAILLGLAGLGVLLYPSVSNWMEQAKQRRQIAAYQEAQAQMEQGIFQLPIFFREDGLK